MNQREQRQMMALENDSRILYDIGAQLVTIERSAVLSGGSSMQRYEWKVTCSKSMLPLGVSSIVVTGNELARCVAAVRRARATS